MSSDLSGATLAPEDDDGRRAELLQRVWSEVREIVLEQLDVVDDAALALLTPGQTCDAAAAARMAHRLAGHLGSFGSPVASDDARGLEDLFTRVAIGDHDRGVVLQIAERAVRMREHVAAIDATLARSGAQVVAVPRAAAGASTADVVVVEDDPVTAHLVVHTLEQHGVTTIVLDDGAVAVSALTADGAGVRGRVVLLDVDLPSVNGLDVLRRLRDAAVLDETKVIMLTARSGEAETIEAFDLGASDHIAKPFSAPVLARRVRLALGE